MRLRLHHIEMCVKDPGPVLRTLRDQFGFKLVGRRETRVCEQQVLNLGRTSFVITSRKSKGNNVAKCNGVSENENVNNVTANDSVRNGEFCAGQQCNAENKFLNDEPWTIFCCGTAGSKVPDPHVDSVFNIAIEVEDLTRCMGRLERMGVTVIQEPTTVQDEHGSVSYAIIKSCCGNVVHTLIGKTDYSAWFIPTFERVEEPVKHITRNDVKDNEDDDDYVTRNSYFDHVALVCRMGDTNSILRWYEDAFEMRRFITNREETEEDGLMIGDDVGLRLKVMEFWKCSEVGLASSASSSSSCSLTDSWEILKIVVAESLPSVRNTQVENFINDHNGPGLQHIGLHTSDMIRTVDKLTRRGVRFRQPPPTYYTEIGQLNSIKAVGEDAEILAKYGILLDDEADPFDEENVHGESEQLVPELEQHSDKNQQRYLMQIFTYPIFDRDTFFLEVIQRRGARGFGVGNVTALARSVNAYQEQLRRMREMNNNVYK